MKDRSLRVLYRRGEDGQLYVLMYRDELHIGTVEVNKFNCMEVFRGADNPSPVFVKYLPKEGSLNGDCLPLSRQDLSQ